MEKNNVKLIGVLASILLLVIIVTASFAYFGSFDTNLTNNVAVNVNSVSPGNATFTSNATELNLQVPAANMSQTASNNTVAAASNTATLTVNLTGAANLLTTCTYDVVYEYDSDSNVYGTSPTTKNSDKEITLQVSNVNGTNNFASEKNFDSISMTSYYNSTNKYYTLVSGASISSYGAITSQNISITAKYYNLNIPQTSLEGSTFTGKIYVTNHKCETSEPAFITILKNNGGKDAIEAREEPDLTTNPTTNEGMYAIEDDYTSTTGLKSFYFRGMVNNNWVKFGKDSSENDMYWRIIRINGDGSVRMIYSGITKPESGTSTVMTGTGTIIGKSVFNDGTTYKSVLVGYQYIENTQNGFGKCTFNNESCEVDGKIVYNSKIKQILESWYNETSFNLNAKDTALVADGIFCNDRSSSRWSLIANMDYAAYTRLNTNKKPILTCLNSDDKFTVNVNNGNGSLTYPVGLITADEVFLAGKNSSYLKVNYDFWTMTPYDYYSGRAQASVYALDTSYNLSSSAASNSLGVRPVINLSSSVKLSGSGTYDDVYVVN